MRVRRVWALIVIASALLLAGCRVDTRVEVTMHADGTGVVHATVTLDSGALQQIGGFDTATKQVPVSDLQRAGWTVSPWSKSANGSASISLTHSYRDQADLARRLTDLVGANGVLRDPRVTRDHGWTKSHDALSLVVDLKAPSSGIGSDADLQTRLRSAGVDPAALDTQLSEKLRSALHLTVVVHLPGGETRTLVGTNGTVSTFSASRTHDNYDTMVKLAIAALLVVLAAVFLLAANMSKRRDRRRRAQRAVRAEPERAPLM